MDGMEMKNLELMKQKIRNESGDAVLVLARLQLQFDENIAMLKANMVKSKVGSKTRLDYIRAISRTTIEYIATLQSLGYVGNVAPSTVTEYLFMSSCGLGGSKPVFTDAQFPDRPRLNP
jgi:hypothetical protein